MKKHILALIILIVTVSACNNDDIEFEDFSYQTIYFPFQTPVRTILLGEAIGDNSIDLEHAFSIGVTMGGVYNFNSTERNISIELKPELMEGIVAEGKELELMPESYFDASFDQVTIPVGDISGKVRVDLTDQFFQDSLSIDLHYVIPLVITDASGDSILSGRPVYGLDNPDIRIASNWEIQPKNYTLFAVKYINPFHGMYFVRGRSIKKESSVNVDTTIYSAEFLTKNTQKLLTTKSLEQNVYSFLSGQAWGLNTDIDKAILSFDEQNRSIEISTLKNGTTRDVTGSGKLLKAQDEGANVWGEKPRTTLILEYVINDGVTSYHVNDTLVYIDNNTPFSEFSFEVIEE